MSTPNIFIMDVLSIIIREHSFYILIYQLSVLANAQFDVIVNWRHYKFVAEAFFFAELLQA